VESSSKRRGGAMIKPLASLRFFFALCVFLSHYTIGENPIFYEGYIGVEFFFILSGFIIAYRYEEKIVNKTISKKDFFVARIARIYPLHCITCLLVALIFLRNTLRTGAPFPWIQLLFNVPLLQSFIPYRSYYFSFNAVSWSISNELFFYAVFPVLVYCLGKLQRNRLIALSAIVLACYFVVISIIPEKYIHALFYINPSIRLIDFIMGIGIFHLWKKIRTTKAETGFYIFLQKKSVATIIEILTLCFLILMVFMSDDIPQKFRYASYYWLPMVLVVLCFAGISPSGGGGGGGPSPPVCF
jgi:peptidoglycan/LPS O-acetylase OafA/YrhL